MPIDLDDEGERLLRELAAITGEDLEEALLRALEERLELIMASRGEKWNPADDDDLPP